MLRQDRFTPVTVAEVQRWVEHYEALVRTGALSVSHPQEEDWLDYRPPILSESEKHLLSVVSSVDSSPFTQVVAFVRFLRESSLATLFLSPSGRFGKNSSQNLVKENLFPQ